MNVTLKISMEYFDDGDFDISNDYYQSDEDYFDKMQIEVDKYSEAITDAMIDGSLFEGGKTARMPINNGYRKNNNEHIYKAEARLLNENGKDENVDDLVTKIVKKELTVFGVVLDMDAIDEVFEEDFRMWAREHGKIQDYSTKFGNEWGWNNEPLRTYTVSFKNKSNEEKEFKLINCRLLEYDGKNEFALIAEGLEFC